MFDELIGNDRVKQLLRRMLAERRLPGALLFTGEEGVGKKLFALEVAKALNCRSPRGTEACGECASCVRIGRINYPQSSDADDWKQMIWTDHPDVGTVVAPKRLLLVDQMRQIEREANFRPYEGKARVFLIDDADKLNDPSANALLKVLEEPPHTSYILLLTSRPAMLLPTIRSRCQMIRFAPIPATEIERYLKLNKLASGSEARVRARVARGSLGRAVNQDIDEFADQRTAMLKVLDALSSNNGRAQLLRASEELNEARYKDEFETRLDVLETLIRDAWMLSLGSADETVVNSDLVPQLRAVAGRLDRARAGQWISQIEEMREQLVVNINRKASTDALFLTMAARSAALTRRRFLIK
jgi:DNA polymerase III subunit delta'